ncbi:TPA: hypothetical protein KD862_003580 [Vibrio cholerae]|nr:hypothetical protein [Vibrio cholerae]
MSQKGEPLGQFNDASGTAAPIKPKNFVEDVQSSKDRAHDRWRKTLVTLALVVLVAVMNWFVIDIVQKILEIDKYLLEKKAIEMSGRIVTENVLLALIGGTVAQVSALFIIAVKSIFSKR